jgi:hypothetical protein
MSKSRAPSTGVPNAADEKAPRLMSTSISNLYADTSKIISSTDGTPNMSRESHPRNCVIVQVVATIEAYTRVDKPKYPLQKTESIKFKKLSEEHTLIKNTDAMQTPAKIRTFCSLSLML